MTETFGLDANAKVVPGVTRLRDPQTGQWFDVVSVLRPEDLTVPGWAMKGGSAERCALYGSPAQVPRVKK